MKRRKFIKNTLIAAGSLLIGGAVVRRLLDNSEPAENPLPSTIEYVHRGQGKNVLVLMSAGTRLGNTDHLTNAYIWLLKSPLRCRGGNPRLR